MLSPKNVVNFRENFRSLCRHRRSSPLCIVCPVKDVENDKRKREEQTWKFVNANGESAKGHWPFWIWMILLMMASFTTSSCSKACSLLLMIYSGRHSVEHVLVNNIIIKGDNATIGTTTSLDLKKGYLCIVCIWSHLSFNFLGYFLWQTLTTCTTFLCFTS